jgi:hypothetical protein
MTDLICIELVYINTSQACLILIGPDGQHVSSVFRLPWTNEHAWNAVYTSIESSSGKNTYLTGPSLAQGIKMGLINSTGGLSSDHLKRVGQTLYHALFKSQPVRAIFEQWLNFLALSRGAQADKECIVVQLYISANGSRLHAYPWELLFNGDNQKFLFNTSAAQIVRTIDVFTNPVSIPGSDTLNVLLVDPRPEIAPLPTLPQHDRSVLTELAKVYSNDIHILGLPDGAFTTLEKLESFFSPTHHDAKTAFVLHIDTHGNYGWLCPECHHLNPPRKDTCESCSQKPGEKPKNLGYMAFEDDIGNIVWIDGERLGKFLYNRPIQMVVLSTCKSGLMGGSSAFNSVAGALIQHQIPAVVAFQNSISVDAAKRFVKRLYYGLAYKHPLVDCMAEARVSMSTAGIYDEDWYRPVLYLGTDRKNPRGELFRERTTFKRDDFVSKIKSFFQQCTPGERQFRLLNLFAPDNLGKTNILQEVMTTLHEEYLILYMPIKQFLSEGHPPIFQFSRFLHSLLDELKIRLVEKTGISIPDYKGSRDVTQLAKHLKALVHQAERAGVTARVLIDDFNLLSSIDREKFVVNVLELLRYDAQVIITSDAPYGNFIKNFLDSPVEVWEMPPISIRAVEEKLPAAQQSWAPEIFATIGSFPALTRQVVDKINSKPGVDLQASSSMDQTILQDLFSQRQEQAFFHEEDPAMRQAKPVLAILRWFNPITIKNLLPKLYPDSFGKYTESDYLELIQILGGQASWRLEGGGWQMQENYQKLTRQYYLLREPRQTRAIHQAAYETYRELIPQTQEKLKPGMLKEMIYHRFELLHLDQASKAAYVDQLKLELDEYLSQVDPLTRQPNDLQKLYNEIQTDPDIQRALPDNYQYTLLNVEDILK